MNIDQKTYHKLLFTFSHYTERVLDFSKKYIKNINEFDKYMIDCLQISCDNIRPFSFFSDLTQKLISESQTKKESREWIERIVKLYDLFKG